MLDVVDHGPIRELRLARPPVNALDAGLITALRQALQQAHADKREALVLSGTPGRFSGGLDIPSLLALERDAIGALWREFFGLMRDLATSGLPVVAALTGHSPAGGTVLALFCDYRVFADGAYVVGLNEVQVGLPVPPALLRALQYVVGERQAARLAVGGLLLGPHEALRCGLVDEVAPLDEVVPRALVWAEELLSRPRAAMRATRALVRRPLREALDTVDDAFVDGLVDQWYSPETQATLRSLASRLGKPPR